MFLSIIQALIAIPKIAGIIEDLISGLMTWYVQRQTNETLADIADAASLSAKAQTSEERFKALDAWRVAISRNRVSK